ncbi:MAG: hypothetical protein ACYTG5_22810, partial [Planctomycetota bacterium]
MRSLIPQLTLCLFALGVACSGEPEDQGENQDFTTMLSQRKAPGIVEHNFGAIPHGRTVQADLPIPMPEDLGPMIPMGFQRNCSCARHEFVIVAKDGSERVANERPEPRFAVREGEQLFLRLSLHTAELEAEDLEPSVVRGEVILQEESSLARRVWVTVKFQYAVESPVLIKPFAHLDLGEIARSASYRQMFELRGRNGKVDFGEPRCLEPDPMQPDNWRAASDLEARLEDRDDHSILHVRFKPSPERPEGPYRMVIEIETDLADEYLFRLPVSGEVISDIQLSPPGKFFFGTIDFTKPAKQFMVITDHRPNHRADFVSRGVVDSSGRDISMHFKLNIGPVPDQSNSQQLSLEYDGKMKLDRKRFAGTIYLARRDQPEDPLRIEILGFHKA